MEEILIKSDPTANVVLWQDAIERQIKYAEKFPLIEIDSIPITQSEIDWCDSMRGTVSKLKRSPSKNRSGAPKSTTSRLLFTLICLAKYSNTVNPENNNWVNRKDSEIFRLANVSVPTLRQAMLFSDLRDLGCIRFSKKVDNININVLCLDTGGEPVLSVTDFRNLGNQYMRFCGGSFLECASCGLVIKRRNNKQLYCDQCSIIVNRDKARERYWAGVAAV